MQADSKEVVDHVFNQGCYRPHELHGEYDNEANTQTYAGEALDLEE